MSDPESPRSSLDFDSLFAAAGTGRPGTTKRWWRGHRYVQAELASIAAKQVEYLGMQAAGLRELVGDNPYGDPRIDAALPLLLDRLSDGAALLDLLLMCMDDPEKKDDGEGDGATDKPAKKTKTVAEQQEELVDGWKKDFEKTYKGDGKNKKHQKFDGEGGYWEWIKRFFITAKLLEQLGKLGAALAKKATGRDPQGWLDVIEGIIKGLKPAAAQAKLKDALIELGKKIAGEWAKDKGSITNKDLQRWLKELDDAVAADKGDGKEVQKAIDKIEGEVDKALGK